MATLLYADFELIASSPLDRLQKERMSWRASLTD